MEQVNARNKKTRERKGKKKFRKKRGEEKRDRDELAPSSVR